MQAILKIIDIVTDLLAKFAAFLLGLIVVFSWIEVVSRYFFNAPTNLASSLARHLVMAAVMAMLPWLSREGYHVAMAHPALQDLYGRTYRDLYLDNGLNVSIGEFGDAPARRWSVKEYLKHHETQDWLPPHLAKSWTYYGLFPNAVIAFTPESIQYYQEIPINSGHTALTGRLYRRPDETRRMRAARYLAYRIDRETSDEDQQLSIWSNESMASEAFDDFHLSDLEYGVRLHHDGLREVLPVLTLEEAPSEHEVASANEALTTDGQR